MAKAHMKEIYVITSRLMVHSSYSSCLDFVYSVNATGGCQMKRHHLNCKKNGKDSMLLLFKKKDEAQLS